jgi:type II secretory ATPase GspE/PulE/Tfp pilus assembly ATPase PilB-like protein
MSTADSTNAHLRQRALQEELRELLDVVGPASLVELLVERAFQLRATDIHLDPLEEGLRVRLRVDGILHTILNVPANAALQMISRLKLMAGMDITERRIPQDGHLSHRFAEQPRDVRVGSGPSLLGERMVLRLMPEPAGLEKLESLGLEPDQLQILRSCAQKPHGLIVAAGPVGSGKTSTVYGCLGIANDPAKSVLTIEDPVERRIPGVTQIQIDSKINFGFPQALRGVLRQDPNVMLIGEIRDADTAHIATRAARAGILVFSTIHANDATAAVDVFRDFGVPPMFLADSLTAVVAQRLIRLVCPQCHKRTHPSAAEREFLGADQPLPANQEIARSVGCEQCFHTGYLGRTGVFEIQTFDDEFRHLLLAGAPREQILERARAQGMGSLRASAAKKVLAGRTSVEELHRMMLTDFD